MKNFLASFHLDLENSLDTLRGRFPRESLIIVFLTGILLYMVNIETTEPVQIKLVLTSIVTLFFSIGIRLFRETIDTKQFSLYGIIPFIYGLLFYLTVEPTSDWGLESFVYFALHLTGFISFTFFAPYLLELFGGKVERIEYTNYFTRTAWTFLMSGIVGISVLLLGYIAIASVTALFDLADLFREDKAYANWAVLSLALFAPLFGLTQIPYEKNVDTRHFEVNKFFSFLIRFVATPFIYIYFFILYAYTVKVLLNFSDWPKGMISWMVIWFSTFGYITYIFSLAYEDDNRIVRIFRKYFPIVVIPQIGMLAYAIGLRISQYDLTMNRYFVVVFGLWLLWVSLYLIFSQRKSLVSITASLALISMIISVGPWSVYALPLERQYTRLVNNLETTWLLVNGKTQTGVVIQDVALENDIYSGIEYVCGFDECSKIKALFPNEYQKAEIEGKKNWESYTYEGQKEYPGASKWDIISAVTTTLWVTFTHNLSENGTKNPYINLSMNMDIYPLDITGYEKMFTISEGPRTGDTASGDYITVSSETHEVVLNIDGQKISWNLTEFDKNLNTKYNAGDRMNLKKDELTTTLTGSGYEVKLIFQNYTIRNPDIAVPQEENNMYYKAFSVYGMALVKKVQ